MDAILAGLGLLLLSFIVLQLWSLGRQLGAIGELLSEWRAARGEDKDEGEGDEDAPGGREAPHG